MLWCGLAARASPSESPSQSIAVSEGVFVMRRAVCKFTKGGAEPCCDTERKEKAPLQSYYLISQVWADRRSHWQTSFASHLWGTVKSHTAFFSTPPWPKKILASFMVWHSWELLVNRPIRGQLCGPRLASFYSLLPSFLAPSLHHTCGLRAGSPGSEEVGTLH